MTHRTRTWSPLQATLVGGGASALLDFIAAMAIYKANFTVIGHAIAMGVLGEAARDSGPGGALLGAALHAFILLVAAGLYVFASRRAEILARWPLLFGPLYGAAIYLAMNYVVVPLSLARRENAQPLEPTPNNLLNMGSHLFLVGLPIALAAWKARRG